jgi:hypothetical protein
LPTELITFSISTCFYGYLQFHVEGRQELLFDQNFKIVTMGSKKRKWAFLDILQGPRNFFSSDSKEFEALPSCSYQDDQPVHQLWPPGNDVSVAEFDVVLFHGLKRPDEVETWKRTWASRANPQDCWAQNWLPHDLVGNIRVLALSYDSCAVQTKNQGHIEDVSELGRNIFQTLVFRFFSQTINPCLV